MRTVTARDLQKKIRQCVDMAQHERIVVTRRGQPAAVIVGVEGSDWEDLVIQTSASFWKLIEARREQPAISAIELRRRLKRSKSTASAVRTRSRRAG